RGSDHCQPPPVVARPGRGRLPAVSFDWRRDGFGPRAETIGLSAGIAAGRRATPLSLRRGGPRHDGHWTCRADASKQVLPEFEESHVYELPRSTRVPRTGPASRLLP